jgi:hypothetical protein
MWNQREMDWIYFDQVRDKWRALVNEVKKIPVPQNVGISCLAEDHLALKWTLLHTVNYPYCNGE